MTAMKLHRYPSPSGGIALGKMGVGAKMTRQLPYDSEVEYLESTGTQWIDTGISPTSSIKCVAGFQVVSLPTIGTNYAWFFGSRDAASAQSGYGVGVNHNHKLFSQYANRTVSDLTVSAGITYNINKNQNITTVNSVVIENSASQFDYTNALYIFALNNLGTVIDQITARLYTFKMYNGNALVRDLIPVRVGNVGYMYDRVSGRLFGNAGTGDFIVGPDINAPAI